MYWLIITFYVLGGLAIVATVLPLWRTTRWWVRLCDFPRFQIAVMLLVILILLPLVRVPHAPAEWAFVSALLAAFLWQMTWIWRYLPGAPREVQRGRSPRGAPESIALLTTNILVPSRGADRLLDIIVEADPDVILAVETDEWWCARLTEGLQSRYPHDVRYPLSNGYGMTLLSRLELVDPEIRFVVDEAIPSIRTGVRMRSGSVVDVYGVHPRPPSVMQDSIERDLELIRVGSEIKERSRPAIVLGDLNDVAWSPDDAGIHARRWVARSAPRARLLQYLSCRLARLALPAGLYLQHVTFRYLRHA